MRKLNHGWIRLASCGILALGAGIVLSACGGGKSSPAASNGGGGGGGWRGDRQREGDRQ